MEQIGFTCPVGAAIAPALTGRVKVTDTVDNPADGLPGGLHLETLGEAPVAGTDDTQAEETQAATSDSSEIPTDPAEQERGYLRQADYTRKTQQIADLRRELQGELEKVRETRALMLQGQQPSEAATPAEEAPLPDPKTDAKGWIEGYIARRVREGVDGALKDSGLSGLRDEVSPLLQRERLGSEYQRFMADSPELDHSQLSAKAGQIIDSDEALSELASNNPRLAVRLAARLAQAQSDADRAKQKNTSRREAAPVSARAGGTVNGANVATIDDAFRLALQQQGVDPSF